MPLATYQPFGNIYSKSNYTFEIRKKEAVKIGLFSINNLICRRYAGLKSKSLHYKLTFLVYISNSAGNSLVRVDESSPNSV